MKVSAFHLMPHRELPHDFEKRSINLLWRHQFNLALSGLQHLSTANPGLTLFVCVNKAIGIEEQTSSCTSLDGLRDMHGFDL